MRRVVGFIVVVWCILAGLSPASAEAGRRVALVIGNGAYEKVTRLPNPPRDAKAMGAMLQSAGFDVLVRTDLGAAAMRRELRDFSEKVQGADMAVVFYAGHGLEVNGTNYLVPVDANLQRDIDVEDEAVPLDRVMQMIESAKRLHLVLLDACRDNPFTRSMKRTMASRSIGRGLAQVDVVASDTLVAFAAKHGSTASDGTGGNSPYTTALVKHLATTGLDVRLALGRVRDEVLRSTGNQQEPFVYGSLGGAEIVLVPAVQAGRPQAGPATASQGAVAPSEAAGEWSRVDKTSAAELETFVRRHGTSPEADYARARLAALRMQQQAAPPRAPDQAKSQIAERDRMVAQLVSKQVDRPQLMPFGCDTLWYLRNAIFARHGFRFKSARAQEVFGTAGTVDDPPFSAVERHNLAEIQAVEKAKSCPG